MAIYAKGLEAKRKFIDLTYKKLLDDHASSLTVRDLAHEKGCSGPALYRHFKSLEYLIVVSSIRFLNKYISEYGKLLEQNKNPLRIYIEGWKLFNSYAFARPDIYYRLFWGQYNKEFKNAIEEYYELFPFSHSELSNDYFQALFYKDNIQERDLWVLKRSVNQGLISIDEAEYFSKTTPLIVKGMLGTCLEQASQDRVQAEQECNYLLEKNFDRINLKN